MARLLIVIPARGGSKGIPRKNLTPCAGKPLIVWTFEHAWEAVGGLDLEAGIVVSTEDDEIAALAQVHGIPVLSRPLELATDEALTAPVIAHAVRQMDQFLISRPDFVAVLQPTVPARPYGLLQECVEHLIRTGADSLHTAYPLHFVWWQESAAYLYDVNSGHHEPARWRSQCPRRPRRQDMDDRERMYHEDGSVFVCKADLIRQTGQYIGDPRKGHSVEVFPTVRTIDIDTDVDLAMAEALLRYRKVLELPASPEAMRAFLKS